MKAEQSAMHKGAKDLISKIPNAPLRHRVPLLTTSFCGMLTLFSNFLGKIYTAVKSSWPVQITYLAELESQVISFLRKIFY